MRTPEFYHFWWLFTDCSQSTGASLNLACGTILGGLPQQFFKWMLLSSASSHGLSATDCNLECQHSNPKRWKTCQPCKFQSVTILSFKRLLAKKCSAVCQADELQPLARGTLVLLFNLRPWSQSSQLTSSCLTKTSLGFAACSVPSLLWLSEEIAERIRRADVERLQDLPWEKVELLRKGWSFAVLREDKRCRLYISMFRFRNWTTDKPIAIQGIRQEGANNLMNCGLGRAELTKPMSTAALAIGLRRRSGRLTVPGLPIASLAQSPCKVGQFRCCCCVMIWCCCRNITAIYIYIYTHI